MTESSFPRLWNEDLNVPENLTPLPRPLCNSGEMMAQKAFVFIIRMLRRRRRKRRREVVTSQQAVWGPGESLGHDVPLASWSGQLSYNHHSAWSSRCHPLPQALWPRGALCQCLLPPPPSPHPPQRPGQISQSRLKPLALPLEATTASSSSASLRSRAGSARQA